MNQAGNFAEGLFSKTPFFQNTASVAASETLNTHSKGILKAMKTVYFKFIYKNFASYTK